MIPFVDLKTQYESIKPQVLAAIEEVIVSSSFISGRYVSRFKEEFCKAHGAQHGVGCSNGTSALFLALQALGVGKDDEVITQPNSFYATAEAICQLGAKPVFVDILEDSYAIDPAMVEKAITSKTRAILPVHLYGNPAPVKELTSLAERNHLFLVEDAAQSHLAQYDGKFIGTFGQAAAFSFYPGKNLGAYGDAGFVIVADQELERKISMLADHGRVDKYEHELVAGNFRMDGIQAAVLSVKLQYLNEWTDKRIQIAGVYDQLFKRAGFKVIEKNNKNKCVYHLYIVEVSNRDDVLEHMKRARISCGIHYPIPLHLQPALKFLGYRKGDFPVTEKTSKRIISIPIYPELSNEDSDYIVNEFLKIAQP